ncbi:MAG: hypothetical protein C4297_08140 [Gemmataceae bacterium]
MARIIVVEGPHTGAVWELARWETILGRQADADCRLDAPEVSRRHACIRKEAAGYVLYDLGSSNGTYVNGQRVASSCVLQEHDRIRIGPFVLRFSAQAAADMELVIRSQVPAQTTNLDLLCRDPARLLRLILDLTQEISRTLDMDALLPQVLDQLLKLFPQADRALVVLRRNGDLELRAIRDRRTDRSWDSSQPLFSRALIHRVLEQGVGLVAEDARLFVPGQTIKAMGVRSFACAPLSRRGGPPLGVLQLDRFGPGLPLEEEDLEVLTAIALQVAAALENAALHAQLVRQAQFEHELALAREIQAGFLPGAPAGGFWEEYELYSCLIPAREVSGDFYDYFLTHPGRMAFVLGDVSGKGMPAALFMVAVRTLCRSLAMLADDPARLLDRLNDCLMHVNPTGMFVSMVAGHVEKEGGRVRLSSAGHLPPILRSAAGAVACLPVPTTRVLGIVPETLNAKNYELVLAPGDLLVLYTDGLTEARAPAGEWFGQERLQQELTQMPSDLPLADTARSLLRSLHRFIQKDSPQDDIGLLLLRRRIR